MQALLRDLWGTIDQTKVEKQIPYNLHDNWEYELALYPEGHDDLKDFRDKYEWMDGTLVGIQENTSSKCKRPIKVVGEATKARGRPGV